MELSDYVGLGERLKHYTDAWHRAIEQVRAGGRVSPGDEAAAHEIRAAISGRGILETPVPPSVIMGVLGIHKRTLFSLRQEGMPVKGRGEYMLGPCVQWALKRADAKARRLGGRGALEQRKLRAQARKTELEVEILAGRHVLRDEVLRSMERAVVEARGTLENLPVQVAALVPGDLRNDVQERGREIVESALRSLAEGKAMPAPAAVETDGGTDEESEEREDE